MKKVLCFIKENKGISIILLIALILRIAVVNELGVNYTLKSDDLGYIESGIRFVEEGTFTMHGVLSSQVMPGMTIFIAFFVLIFGKGITLMLSLKIMWIVMGIITIYFVYKIVNIYTSKLFSCISACFFLALDFAWIDTVILTETPFMLIFVLLIYNSLMLAKTREKKYFWLIVLFYIVGVFIRPNIGIFPIFLIVYLLWCGYDKKVLLKQTIIALGILLVSLTPWTIRNYYHYNKFIPLTYGTGNPLLLGTYQGYGYPDDKELDYKKNVDTKMSKEMYDYIYKKEIKKKYMLKYYWLEHDKYKAEYRMNEWWKNDPKSMIVSYAILKPLRLVYGTYSIDVLGVSKDFNLRIREIDLLLFVISLIAIILNKRRIKETVFLLMIYASQIALYAYTYAFPRYGHTLYFIRFIIIGIGLYIIYEYFIRKFKNKSV